MQSIKDGFNNLHAINVYLFLPSQNSQKAVIANYITVRQSLKDT